ncbi:MAG: sigma-54 dependent transcriptional regulator [Bdellovibrionales bacterium]|nr:sigma-54 dependent transcriptional regulator [Bdellovibrionales bacterium]
MESGNLSAIREAMFGSKKIKTLLIEDDAIFRTAVEKATSHILDLSFASSVREAKILAKVRCFDLVLLDKKLPDGIGIDLIPELKMANPHCVVLVLTSDPTDESIVEALDLGASDYLVKTPHIQQDLLGRILVARGRLAIEQRCRNAERLADDFFSSELVGKSNALIEIREEIETFGPSQVNVLITGETGTGKELIAKALHLANGDRTRPFITLNCAAFQETLIESELFGHTKGSFTGAATDKVGKVELANGGDLFLDEIGELPLDVQSKLLRVLQDGEYYRVGSNEKRHSKFRVISATNRDLRNRVSEGEFREDLLFRINSAEIFTSPLRDRPEDIPDIASHLLHKIGGARYFFAKDALEQLCKEKWNGNVRELKNRIERAHALASRSDRTKILLSDVAPDSRRRPQDYESGFRPGLKTSISYITPTGYKQAIAKGERDFLIFALNTFNNDVLRTAESLGMSKSALYRRLDKLEISRNLSGFMEASQ